jgi:hypothetical protein
MVRGMVIAGRQGQKSEIRNQKSEVRNPRNDDDLESTMTKDDKRAGLRFGDAASPILVNDRFSARASGSTYTICGSEAWSGPQFCRGVVGPPTAPQVASADTAKGTTDAKTIGTSRRATKRATSRATPEETAGTTSRATRGAATDSGRG